MNHWLEEDQKYLMNVYHRMPFAIERAEGHYLIDTNGDRFMDLFCGVGVTALGHRHPAVMQAIAKQAEKYLHISNNFANPSAVSYAKALVDHTFGKGKVFFGNSGAEASESAIKLVHKWAKHLGQTHRGILVLTGSYHGRTTAAMQLTRQPNVHQDFPITTMPFYEVAREDSDTLLRYVQEYRPHAILVETVLGAGGVYPLSDSFLATIQQACEASEDTLLIVDEVQTGFGRTGTFFSYEQTPLKPDVVVFAKAAGGGLPLSGIITNERTMDLYQAGDHGTTFGPNPLSIAAGHALFDALFESGAMLNATSVSDLLRTELDNLKNAFPSLIADIRHKGMMFGISLRTSPEETVALQQALVEKGILVDVTQKTVVRLLPPLSLTRVEALHFIDMFRTCLSRIDATIRASHPLS